MLCLILHNQCYIFRLKAILEVQLLIKFHRFSYSTPSRDEKDSLIWMCHGVQAGWVTWTIYLLPYAHSLSW